MSTTRSTSRFICFSLIMLLLVTCFTSLMAAEPITSEDNGDDLEDIEELMALDEEEEQQQQQQQQEDGVHVKSSEAEILSKAQRIVLELNNDNTKRVIDGNEFVLVLGYAPWCVRSAELMPQFAEAANLLKEWGSRLLLAKLDAERYTKAASTLGIKGFPTLLLFTNGSSQVYTGGFSAEEIVIWARKKTGVPVLRIIDQREAEEFVKRYPVFVVGLFEKFEGPDYEEFIKSATSDNEIQFVETNNIGVAKVLFPDIKPFSPFIGLVKSEPERYTTFEGSFKMDNIMQFLEYNKFPLVTTLTELNSLRVYSSPIKLQIFVFASADEFKSLLQPLQSVAKKFKSKIMFVYVDITEENLAKPLLTLYGLEESQKTTVTAFNNRISSKYLLGADPTASNIEEFCSGILNGTLSSYFKSQPIPNNDDASIHIVVGKTFDELVLSNPKNVLLEVHTPWCINCDATSKQIEKLAKHFKAMDNLIFAKIDASANEHSKLQVDDFPALLFYPADDKSNPIKVSTKYSLKDLAAFINKNVKYQDKAFKDEL